MSKNNNKIYVNIVREYDDNWIGFTFESCKIAIQIKSFSDYEKLKKIDIDIENIKCKSSQIELETTKDSFENIHTIKEFKLVIKEYQQTYTEILNSVGIYDYDLILDFYLDHNNYWIKEDSEQTTKQMEVS